MNAGLETKSYMCCKWPIPQKMWKPYKFNVGSLVWLLLLLFVVHSSEFDTPLGSSGPASPAPSPVPDIDYPVPDTGSIKEVGFYLLRKDSERRSTLVRVMTEDQDAVSDMIQIFLNVHLKRETHTWTAPSKTMDWLSLSSLISEWVGKCTVRFWKSRSLNNDHMARCRGCSTDYLPHINDGTLTNLHNEWV